MSTPSSHAGYREIARKALHPTTGVPGLSDWEVFLHGFTDTNMRGDSRRIYDCLINLFPTPESLTEWPTVMVQNKKDPTKWTKVPKYELPNTGGCENLQSRVNAGKWLVHNGDNWARIAPLLRCKTDESQAELRDLDKTGKRGAKINQNRLLQKEMKGAGLKGADMHLLWGGCEVPVIDIQLIRYMAPQVLGQPWRDWVVDLLQARKDAGKVLLLNPGMPAELQVWIPASEIDINKRTHISGEEKAQQSLIQGNPGRYGEWRDAAYRMADAEGLKANKWHVANWLEAREGGDPDKPETQTRGVTDTERLESVKKFSEYTFGPTSFPDAPATWPLPPERYQDKSGLKPSAYGDEAPVRVYTGSDEPFTQFDESMIASRTDCGFAGRGAYTTTDPEKASRWGKYVMETTIPSDARLLAISGVGELYEKHGLKELTPEERELPQAQFRPIHARNINDWTDRKIAEGYDGVEWTMSSGDRQYVLFKPGQCEFAVTEKEEGPEAYRDEAPGTPEWFKEQISLVMRGQTGQSLSTKQALNMLNQIRSKAGAYSDVVELIDQHIDSLEGFGDEPSRKTREASWADMTPEEQERWRKEAEVRATEARKQLQTEVGREVGYMDQDMWEVIMPTESLYHWTLPFPRGGFPQTPRLRETRKSIYYAPGWLKIRAYGAQNPHLTVGQIAKDLGYSRGYVGNSLHGRFPADGSYLGPRIHVFRDERTTKAFETMVERYGGEKAERAAEEIRAEVIQAYQEHPDLSADEIAVIFNISATALYNWLREAGIERRMVGHAGPELKAKVAQTYTDRPDLTVEEIAEMYGISDQSVVNWRREAGIERRFRMPSPEERAEAVQMYLDRPDLTVEEIAEIYGVHDRTVNIWVREAEVGRRGTGFKKPSFPALSGLSRYAADIQMLVS